jgi:V8-like Glu-specific endopeptidase
MPYGSVAAREYWAPRGFIEGPDRGAWDWGLIVLSRPIEGITRFPSLRPLSDTAIQRLIATAPVTVVGYPSDRPVGTMWRHSERLVRATPRRLFHTVDTCPGHSGSPILARIDSEPAVIGVHTAGLLDPEGRSHGCRRGTVLAPPGSVNSGIRLVPGIVAALGAPHRPGSGPARLRRLP